jgi:SCY1-like protein 1
MADSVLPPPSAVDAASANNAGAARIGTSNDTSWAGWAISSFTNKLTAAKGEIEPTKLNGINTVAEPPRPSSVPQATSSPSVAQPARHAALRLSAEAPALARTASDTAATAMIDTSAPLNDDDWGADAWDDDGGAATKDDEDQFFDVGSSPAPGSPTHNTAAVAATVPYDDGGEPDFAGWLAAQSKAKTKKPLPKGLNSNKASTAKVQTATRSAPGSRAASSRPSPRPSKVIDTTPKDQGDEDGWGDAW